jgi:hypothetical protein
LKQLPGVAPAAARDYFKIIPKPELRCQ